MNKLFYKKSGLTDRKKGLETQIKLTTDKLINLKNQLNDFQNENYRLINLYTTPILFYFGRVKQNSSLREQFTGYFYNYVSGTVIYKLDDFVTESENIIDVREFFDGIPLSSDNIKDITNKINSLVGYFMHRYDPDSWEELFDLIKSGIKEDVARKILTQK